MVKFTYQRSIRMSDEVKDSLEKICEEFIKEIENISKNKLIN